MELYFLLCIFLTIFSILHANIFTATEIKFKLCPKTLLSCLVFLRNIPISDIVCNTDDAVDLARQIAYAVDEAEEIIDCHVVDQLSQGSAYDVDMGFSSFRDDLERILDKIESSKRELKMVKDQESVVKASPQARVFGTAAGSSAPLSTGKMNSMVGFDDSLFCIMDQLTGDESDLQIVSITGMGGIGKTTLAQSVFGNRCIVDHFDLCKWVTISQSYSIQQILISLAGGSENENLAELGGKLHKMLFGRRYLIIMDDVWSTEVWGELRRFFPNNKNGSRVLVTTRLSQVSVSFGSQKPYSMPFLDNEISWKLFCIKAFGKEVCPNPELEKIGKKIVECCKGLPLAISTIGGLLGKSNMTRDEWELVAKDVLMSIDNSKDEGDCSYILSLSYKHLPIHLKPCFLYMRIFHEDERISVRDLINYWVVEGSIKLKDGQTLEDVALEYLKDLMDRSLILIHELHRYTGDIRTCKVHDLLRDLCMREYEKESVFVISKVCKIHYYPKPGTCLLCSYRKASTCIDLPQVCSTTTTLVSCFVCDICNLMCSNRNRLRLVKVAVYYGYGRDYLKPTRLRYLGIRDDHNKFESTVLSLLWNLYFLDLHIQRIDLPAIWEMPQLRYFKVGVHPPFTQTGRKDCCSLEKLQFLKVKSEGIDCWCVEEILKRIPNVKTLNIECKNHSKEVHSVGHLQKLQRLICERVDVEYLSFPRSLKSLELIFCDSRWEEITIIGSLPNLEVLIIKNFKNAGPEWNPIEGEFLRLKMLRIHNSYLMRWNAEKYHFPRLEMLQLEYVIYLEEIPSGFGDIDTLRQIRLTGCTERTVRSAKVTEQRDCGNEELQLFIDQKIHDVDRLREIRVVRDCGIEKRMWFTDYTIYL